MRRYEKFNPTESRERFPGFRECEPFRDKEACKCEVINFETESFIHKWWCERPKGHTGEHCNYSHNSTLTIWDDAEVAESALRCALLGDGK